MLLLLLIRGVAAGTPLPSGLEWRRLPTIADISTAVQPLLRHSYVATPDDELRLDYSAADLRWMLSAPDALEDLRVAIAEPGDSSIVAFVCAVPCPVVLHGKHEPNAVEVSLLCVRRDWRGRGLTRLLLAELRRRAADHGIRCALYTATEPRHRDQRALLTASCFHRPLRPLELLRCGFWQPPETVGPVSPRRRRALLREAVHDATRLPSRVALHYRPWAQQSQQQSQQQQSQQQQSQQQQSQQQQRQPQQRQPQRPLDGDGAADGELGDADGPLLLAPHEWELRRMRARDVPACLRLLRRRASSGHFALAPALSAEQFHHRFLGPGARTLVIVPRHRRGARRAAPGSASPAGFVSFILLPLRTAGGRQLVQAQVQGYAADEQDAEGEQDAEDRQDAAASTRQRGSGDGGGMAGPVLLQLLCGALRLARREGAAVLNVHGIGELAAAPEALRALGFREGDAATSICVEAANAAAPSMAASVSCWLPLL